MLRFNRSLADCDPERFITDILVDVFRVKYLVVGDDFHFGKARRGNFALLKERGSELGFRVEETESFLVDGHRVSSTLIRDALGEGDLATAELLLGRLYSVCGRVAHGEQRGRTLGFPTANIQMFRKNTPIEGVFAVTMTGADNAGLVGVSNVGTRPTVTGDDSVLLETHLLDFNEDIYGRYVEVHFRKKIRDEMRFDSLADLSAQIARDVDATRQFFADN